MKNYSITIVADSLASAFFQGTVRLSGDRISELLGELSPECADSSSFNSCWKRFNLTKFSNC